MAQLTHKPSPGRVTHPFGAPPATSTSPRHHLGTDFGWGNGREIYAAANGRVKSYGYVGAYGNRLVIDHGSGVETWYCHLASASVSVGAWVTGGQRIATMGATGNVTAMHLHFEYRLHGVPYDPMTKFTSQAGGGATPIEPEPEDEMVFKIIAPYGMPDRGVVGPGTGIAFGNEGDFQHFCNVWGLDRNAIAPIGGPEWSEGDRRDLFNRIIEMHRVGSAPAIPTPQQIANAVVAALPKSDGSGGATKTEISDIVTAAIKAAFARAAE